MSIRTCTCVPVQHVHGLINLYAPTDLEASSKVWLASFRATLTAAATAAAAAATHTTFFTISFINYKKWREGVWRSHVRVV